MCLYDLSTSSSLKKLAGKKLTVELANVATTLFQQFYSKKNKFIPENRESSVNKGKKRGTVFNRPGPKVGARGPILILFYFF